MGPDDFSTLFSDLETMISKEYKWFFNIGDKTIQLSLYREFKSFCEEHLANFFDIVSVKEVTKQDDKITALTLCLQKEMHSIQCRLYLNDEVDVYLQESRDYFDSKELKREEMEHEARMEARQEHEELSNWI